MIGSETGGLAKTDKRAVLELVDADLGYDGRPVLRSVSLCIHEGDFVGIVGPNGAGKTTLLRAMAGNLRPIRGRVSYGCGARSSARFGFVPQRQALDELFPLSVLDVVLMGRYALIPFARRPSTGDKERAESALAQVGMQEAATSAYRDLSGGQKQRVLIARALAGDPEVLLLDEPTADLDLAGQRDVMELLSKLQQEQGMTLVVVSHILHQVLNYAQVIGFVVGGNVRLQNVEDAVSAKNLGSVYGIHVEIANVGDRWFVF